VEKMAKTNDEYNDEFDEEDEDEYTINRCNNCDSCLLSDKDLKNSEYFNSIGIEGCCDCISIDEMLKNNAFLMVKGLFIGLYSRIKNVISDDLSEMKFTIKNFTNGYNLALKVDITQIYTKRNKIENHKWEATIQMGLFYTITSFSEYIHKLIDPSYNQHSKVSEVSEISKYFDIKNEYDIKYTEKKIRFKFYKI
jgi:hypothetical protein